MSDRFHRAARDGYLDLLREATRQECDRPDEDGMTPTSWAAYHGNLDALRLLISRGGNPDKADLIGNTALHCAAANGHMNCVAFLVNFGANLWSLDNEFHTPLDLAADHEHMHIVKFLDLIVAQHSARNRKVVQKLKEKAALQAQKRIKQYHKLQVKAGKKAMREDLKLAQQRELMDLSNLDNQTTFSGNTFSLSRNKSPPKLYSDYLSINRESKRGLVPGGVAKRISNKKKDVNGEFKILENGDEGEGRKSVRSLRGLRRDSEVLYVKNASLSANSNQRKRLTDVFDGMSYISRSHSEPDFSSHSRDSGVNVSYDSELLESASLFERPGFGSFAFFSRPSVGAMLSLPVKSESEEQAANSKSRSPRRSPRPTTVKRNHVTGVKDDLSIGTLGSLAHRMRELPWNDDEVESLDDDDDVDSNKNSSLELFLAAHGLCEFMSLLNREKIDLDALMLCSDNDLKDSGVPLGPRRKILDTIEKRRTMLHAPGTLVDSYL